MPWRNCLSCGRSYNDQKGGCTNRACKSFDNGADSGTLVQGSSLAQGTGRADRIVAAKTPNSLVTSAKPRILQPSNSDTVVPDPQILSWIETATTRPGRPAPAGFELKAEPFTLICYRGEKTEWWPEPRMRLAAGGMHVFEPWPGKTITEIWNRLIKEIRGQPGFTTQQRVAAYAQYLRAEGRPFALATARTKTGSFLGYYYEIEIKNARTFRWGKDFSLGPPANFKDTQKTIYERIINQNKEIFMKDTIDADYIVLNADTIAESTVLGFGHKTGTYEVMFLHDLSLSFVKSVNGAMPSPYTKEELDKLQDGPHKRTALKLFRD